MAKWAWRESDNTFAAGVAAAVAMCRKAEAYYNDPEVGSAHSAEAREVGRAQCDWLAGEIARLKLKGD